MTDNEVENKSLRSDCECSLCTDPLPQCDCELCRQCRDELFSLIGLSLCTDDLLDDEVQQ